jgi:hypothetical protein
LIFIKGLLAALEDYRWPWVQDHLDQHSEDREHYVEVLNAQEEGFDVVWGNEEDFDFDALD